jgi:hypothetical protein
MILVFGPARLTSSIALSSEMRSASGLRQYCKTFAELSDLLPGRARSGTGIQYPGAPPCA